MSSQQQDASSAVNLGGNVSTSSIIMGIVTVSLIVMVVMSITMNIWVKYRGMRVKKTSLRNSTCSNSSNDTITESKAYLDVFFTPPPPTSKPYLGVLPKPSPTSQACLGTLTESLPTSNPYLGVLSKQSPISQEGALTEPLPTSKPYLGVLTKQSPTSQACLGALSEISPTPQVQVCLGELAELSPTSQACLEELAELSPTFDRETTLPVYRSSDTWEAYVKMMQTPEKLNDVVHSMKVSHTPSSSISTKIGHSPSSSIDHNNDNYQKENDNNA